MPEVDNTRIATPLVGPHWRGRVVVVSPHLDDAVFSVGASMRAASRHGVKVDVLTVLSGNPDSATPSDQHNRQAGFATAGEASRVRRLEDQRACQELGARALWLPFADDANEARPDDDDIVAALAGQLEDYDAVLLPGFPLRHRDHRRISRLTLQALEPTTVVGFYVEQPYASWRAFSRRSIVRSTPAVASLADIGLRLTADERWQRTLCAPSDWAAKARAAGAYHSQMAVLRKAPRARILAYELLRGGERVLWCTLR